MKLNHSPHWTLIIFTNYLYVRLSACRFCISLRNWLKLSPELLDPEGPTHYSMQQTLYKSASTTDHVLNSSLIVKNRVKNTMACSSTSHLEWTTDSYVNQKDRWPQTGKHILAQYDEESVVVYQAFCPEIAHYATLHQRYVSIHYSLNHQLEDAHLLHCINTNTQSNLCHWHHTNLS